jgi:hypothetical protein
VLAASTSFAVFDYLRVPYRIDRGLARASGWGVLRPDRPGAPELRWPCFADGPPPQPFRLGAIRLHGAVARDDAVRPLLGAGANPVEEVLDARGARLASVWRAGDGALVLPFDPAQAMTGAWSERYLDGGGRRLDPKALARRAYYRVRPALPRRAQIGLRRLYSRVQLRTPFPRWPAEPALHDLYDLVLGWTAELAGEPVPWIAPWPAGRSWAVVLTHDVETEAGYWSCEPLRELEVAAGFRSSWNFVPRRYRVEQSRVEQLLAEGFEVGVHGLYHDGRDLESLGVLHERLPAIRDYAQRWHAVGFRSPATHRVWEWMPLLGFDYDSSYPDTDPFEPMGGGCCTWLPYFNDGLVELPITLPQDHTLFVILREDESRWLDKAALLRERGGMALLITHPDYMGEPERLDAYARFLTAVGDDGAWRALPREVSAWWRRRAASHLECTDGGWRVVGPAADEAAVTFAQAA